MFRLSIKPKPSTELKDFSKFLSKLAVTLEAKALSECYQTSVDQLKDHYGLPAKGYSRRRKSSAAQMLRLRHGKRLDALDKPISLIRFVEGSQRMKLRGISPKSREGLTLKLSSHTTSKTKHAFSGRGQRTDRLVIFQRRKIKGKDTMRAQRVPSAYKYLTRQGPQAALEKNLSKFLIGCDFMLNKS